MLPVLLQNLSGPCQATENIETEGLLTLHGVKLKVNKTLYWEDEHSIRESYSVRKVCIPTLQGDTNSKPTFRQPALQPSLILAPCLFFINQFENGLRMKP